MIKENDIQKPKSSSPFTFINLTSLIVVFISLFFTYHYLSSFNNNSIQQESYQDNLNKILNAPDKLTFIDRFKQQDLSLFVNKNALEDRDKFNATNVDQFNNNQLLPRLRSIVDMDYFKYIKLNLNKKCKLWSDDAKCSRMDCTIQTCDESSLPDYIVKDGDNLHPSPIDRDCDDKSHNSTSDQLQQIVTNVISTEKISRLNDLFECYVSEYEDGEFYDLKMNPEQFTGYKGPTAHRIWRSIYEENCFKSKKIHQLTDQTESNANNAQLLESFLNVDDLCLEERIFYRAISGLHTSINIHLSTYYHFKDGSIGFNLKEFLKRFEG